MYKPNFIITPEINKLIAMIETTRQKIKDSHILPEAEIALRYRAAIDAIYSSTTIEGNPLNKNQVEKALAGKMPLWQRAVTEVINYKKALDWINKRVKNKKDIDLSDILKLHYLLANKLLPKEKVGKIRTGPVYIVDIIGKREIVKYTGPDARKVETYINNLLYWLKKNKDSLHPILAAAIVHYEFVSIHPFSDGNGRATRLLVKLYLDLMAYDFRGALTLDKYYLENRMSYYKALNKAKTYRAQTKADLTSWIEFFTRGFYQMTSSLEKSINVVNLGKDKEMIRLSDDEFQLLDYTKQFGRIKSSEVITALRVSERTAQRILNKMIKKNLIVIKGKGKNIFYQLKTRKYYFSEK